MHDATMLDSEDNRLIDLLARHFVLLTYRATLLDGTVQDHSVSGFVITVQDHLFFLTAGHAFHNMDVALHAGVTLSNFHFCDSFAVDTLDFLLPINFERSDRWYVYDPDRPSDADYGIYFIQPFDYEALTQNVVPLNIAADYDRLVDQPYDMMVAVGVPEETLRPREGNLSMRLVTFVASHIGDQEISPILNQGTMRRIYGWITGDLEDVDILSIKGMSGGPVFGIWLNEDRTFFDYSVIGIQSGWDPNSRQIAACPLDDLSHALLTGAST